MACFFVLKKRARLAELGGTTCASPEVPFHIQMEVQMVLRRLVKHGDIEFEPAVRSGCKA